MEAIFFNEEKSLGMDIVKLLSDDFLLQNNFEHYPNLMDDEGIFINPFLIAHFNQSSREVSQPINQILLGSIEETKRPESIEVRSCAAGAIYLPKIGYLATEFPHTDFTLNISSDSSGEKYNLVLEGKDVPFAFEALRFVPDTNIEIFRYSHEYIIHKLKSNTFIKVDLETESNDWVDKFSGTMTNTFAILQKADPEQFNELKELLQTVVFFKADIFTNFTSKDFQGVIFISVDKTSEELIFIDTLVHECSHLALNLVLIHPEEYFTVPPYELKFRSPFRDILRGIYQSIHACYVLAKLIRCLNKCYKAEVFSGLQRYELISMLLLNMRLLGEGLSYIEDRSIYTDKGWGLFEEIRNVYNAVHEERQDIIDQYKLPSEVENASVTPKSFKMADFLKANNLSSEDFGQAA